MADGAVATRSESEEDIGYEPSKDGVGELGPDRRDADPGEVHRALGADDPRGQGLGRKVSFCESRHDPNVLGLGGEYRGAFQFTMDAWRISPNSPGGDPIDYSYKVQAVVAVSLMHEMGTGPWPVCGSR